MIYLNAQYSVGFMVSASFLQQLDLKNKNNIGTIIPIRY